MTKTELEAEVKRLKAQNSKLLAKEAKRFPLPIEDYQKDFKKRWENHLKEWDLLFKQDLPLYWSKIKSTYQQARSLFK